MCKKWVYSISFVLALCLLLTNTTYAEDPTLVGWWNFNEGSGSVAKDSSMNGNDGTLEGDPTWVAGIIGGALDFDGTDDYVETGTNLLPVSGDFAIALWLTVDGGVLVEDDRAVVEQGPIDSGGDRIYLYSSTDFGDANGQVRVWSDPTGQVLVGPDIRGAGWKHLALLRSGNDWELYVDGTLYTTGSNASSIPEGQFFIGAGSADGRYHFGQIDDVRLYNRVLREEEILSISAGLDGGWPYASSPFPADGTLYEDTWVTMSWSAGDSAVSHDVYLGESFDDVNNATPDSDVFRGNQETDFYIAGFPGFAYPDGLTPGTTYYWRIDEVNDADPNSPWKGLVWSFSIPTNKAHNPIPADGADSVPLKASLNWTTGFGAKMHTIYFGNDYDTIANATVGMPIGTTQYDPGPLESEKVYYWRVDEFDGLNTIRGDVWAFATQGAVGNPQPTNGATDVAMATILSWTAADNAASHEVYLGLDKDTVRIADTSSPEYKGSRALGAESYDPGLLDLNTMYYWRVDEVYNGNPVRGPVWNFMVSDYLLVDDFESYTDDDPNNQAIWQHWIDGFGVADNGAQVGNLMPPYAEQTIVHGGDQSMPLFYVNEAGVTNSEATLTLTALRDWTMAGIDELSLWVQGDSANAAESLYVAISNNSGAPGVVAHEESDVATRTVWSQWRIPLQAFADQGINLTNVDKIAIGLGSKGGAAAAGGSGTMYIDDIRLY